jgi:hypothetical protein
MLASTYIAVLFVPSFFVVLHCLAERCGRHTAVPDAGTAPAMPPKTED